MSELVGISGMAAQTLSGSGPHRLELSGRQTQLMDIVTRGAGNAFLGVNRLLPVIVLLMMAIAMIVGVDLYYIFTGVWWDLLIRPQSPAGYEAHRPVNPFNFCRFAAAMAGAAELGSDARRKFGWIDNGLTFIKDRCFR